MLSLIYKKSETAFKVGLVFILTFGYVAAIFMGLWEIFLNDVIKWPLVSNISRRWKEKCFGFLIK